jgi:RNA polymerase sigma factor (sigma-70 family)
MNSLFALVRTGLGDATDQNLLDRFRADRDEEAFAELVRRYGPLVWGVCRRSLAHPADAEDAFQVTFLVLARRAGQLAAAPGVGPWLHRVAVMTARNVRRGNRRRAPVGGRIDHDVPVPDLAPGRTDDRLDLDAALTRLPEKHRAAVVLCHLQGLSRREAAARLGCPEGTLSATLAAALRKLRAQLRVQDPAALLAAVGAVAVPAGLSAATARVASVDSISRLAAAGVSPAVAGLTNGVLRMFWAKKLVTAAVMVAAVGGLLTGLTLWPDGATRAADPPPERRAEPAADPAAAARKIERKLADLGRQKAELDRAIADAQAEQAKLDAEQKEKAAAADLGPALAIAVTEGGKGWGWGKPSYTIREVVNGRVGELYCYDLGVLATYLTRTANDSKGPRTLRIYADQDFSHDQIHRVLGVCAAAGFKKALFILPKAPMIVSGVDFWTPGGARKEGKVEWGQNPKELDLTRYAPPVPAGKP